jgi:hypothetical protein
MLIIRMPLGVEQSGEPFQVRRRVPRMMRRQLLYTVICLTLMFPALAPAKKLRVDHNPAFDFSSLQRYEWRTHPEMEKDPELAQRAIAGDIVMSEGNRILMGRGYVPDESSPQFYITFFVKSRETQEATAVSTSWYYGPGPAWVGYSERIYRQFVDGTLVIDIVDAKENRLVWRAMYSDKVRNWKTRHKIIAKAVRNALKKFPPKQRK